MIKIKDFLLDENKLSISKINFIVNCLIILSIIYYRKTMTYMVLLLIGFNMFRMMLKEIIIKKVVFFISILKRKVRDHILQNADMNEKEYEEKQKYLNEFYKENIKVEEINKDFIKKYRE